MPFGLCNAPAAFQRWINRTLHQFVDICCIVYFDDVLIYSKTNSEHIRDIRAILKAIQKSGMKIKAGKCEFHAAETEYLGFLIETEGIKVDPIKTATIWEWAKPTKVKEIQRFTGFCNFYRRFIEEFSRKARPLYQLTRKDKKWEWGKKEDEAFDEIRTHLTSTATLIHFDPKHPITIETDSSDYVTAGILSQPGKDGMLHPVAYRSKAMTKAECNYDVHDKELLAIVKTHEDWRRYVSNTEHRITILTDHQNLVPFMTTKKLVGRQIQWMEILSQYYIKIEYRPGKEGGKPDALTRREGDLPNNNDE